MSVPFVRTHHLARPMLPSRAHTVPCSPTFHTAHPATSDWSPPRGDTSDPCKTLRASATGAGRHHRPHFEDESFETRRRRRASDGQLLSSRFSMSLAFTPVNESAQVLGGAEFGVPAGKVRERERERRRAEAEAKLLGFTPVNEPVDPPRLSADASDAACDYSDGSTPPCAPSLTKSLEALAFQQQQQCASDLPSLHSRPTRNRSPSAATTATTASLSYSRSTSPASSLWSSVSFAPAYPPALPSLYSQGRSKSQGSLQARRSADLGWINTSEPYLSPSTNAPRLTSASLSSPSYDPQVTSTGDAFDEGSLADDEEDADSDADLPPPPSPRGKHWQVEKQRTMSAPTSMRPSFFLKGLGMTPVRKRSTGPDVVAALERKEFVRPGGGRGKAQ